jgi:hypothetical protein
MSVRTLQVDKSQLLAVIHLTLNSPEEQIVAIGVAQVAVVVLAPQVPEQLVLVEESQFAVLTPWMSLVAFIVGIADTSVCRQL